MFVDCWGLLWQLLEHLWWAQNKIHSDKNGINSFSNNVIIFIVYLIADSLGRDPSVISTSSHRSQSAVGSSETGHKALVLKVQCINYSLSFFYSPSFYRASVCWCAIDIANLSVHPLLSGILWKRINILSISSPFGSPVCLVLWLSNVFAKFWRVTPCGGINTGGV